MCLYGFEPSKLKSEEDCMVSRLAVRKKQFNRLLLDAVDESLSCLGESPKQLIYVQLEKEFDIKKHEIPHKIDKCGRALERIFGQGAAFLEIQIMKNLHAKTNCTFEWHEPEYFYFVRYVTMIKLSFLGVIKEKPVEGLDISVEYKLEGSIENK
jgi:hypothetical protein